MLFDFSVLKKKKEEYNKRKTLISYTKYWWPSKNTWFREHKNAADYMYIADSPVMIK